MRGEGRENEVNSERDSTSFSTGVLGDGLPLVSHCSLLPDFWFLVLAGTDIAIFVPELVIWSACAFTLPSWGSLGRSWCSRECPGRALWGPGFNFGAISIQSWVAILRAFQMARVKSGCLVFENHAFDIRSIAKTYFRNSRHSYYFKFQTLGHIITFFGPRLEVE